MSREAFGFPGSPLYPSLLGTNSSFRKPALVEIGGFDETFAYFLDETDVCLRLADQGGQIVYAPEAWIFHGYAPSHLRSEDRVPERRYFPVRSKVYFMFRHGRSVADETALNQKLSEYREGLRRDNAWLAEHGRISGNAGALLDHDVERAIDDGLRLAGQPAPTRLRERMAGTPPRAFRPFPPFRREEKLRVALISQGFPPSDTQGIARWTHQVATGLAVRGHRVHVITRAEDFATIDFVDGIWVHRVTPSASGGVGEMVGALEIPASLRDASAAVFAELAEIGLDNLDLVSAPIWDLEGLIPLLLASVPVVTSLHTTYRLALPFKPDWNRPVYRQGHVDRVIDAERFLLEKAPWLLANSRAVVADLEKAYGVDLSQRTFVVPHGVNPVEVMVWESSHHLDVFTVLFVGRQESRKGFDSALKAAIAVCERLPKVEFRLAGAAGEDPQCLRAIELLEACPATIRERIHLEGYLADEALWAAYAACDLFLAPSRYESFGLVAIEAMRFGKPVVVGNVGGLAEIIEDGREGCLVDPDQPAEIAAAILSILEDPAKRRAMGAAALERFQNEFTTDRMIDEIEKVYRTIRESEPQPADMIDRLEYERA